MSAPLPGLGCAARFARVTTPRRCVCPGSYDPVTHGHVDVITRAAALYDEVVVAVLHNPAKQGTFSVGRARGPARSTRCARPAERPDRAVRAACCSSTSAGRSGRTAIVKGLRGGTDFAYELPMALMNRHLTGVETVFLPGDPEFEHVSSSLVKEVAALRRRRRRAWSRTPCWRRWSPGSARAPEAEPPVGPPRRTDPHLGAGATLR